MHEKTYPMKVPFTYQALLGLFPNRESAIAFYKNINHLLPQLQRSSSQSFKENRPIAVAMSRLWENRFNLYGNYFSRDTRGHSLLALHRQPVLLLQTISPANPGSPTALHPIHQKSHRSHIGSNHKPDIQNTQKTL